MNWTQVATDIARMVVIASWGVLLGLVVRVFLDYREAEKLAPRNHPGLLARHVVVIATSYLLLAAEAVYHNVYSLGDPITAYLFINGIAFSLGIYALILVTLFQRRRVSILTGKVAIKPPEVFVPPSADLPDVADVTDVADEG